MEQMQNRGSLALYSDVSGLVPGEGGATPPRMNGQNQPESITAHSKLAQRCSPTETNNHDGAYRNPASND